MNDCHVILASASPRRSELLRKSGIEPEVIPSDVDENIQENDPEKLVAELSKRKCEDIASKLIGSGRDLPDHTVVIGADTVVSIDGSILGKPGDEKEAADMLSGLSGRTHQVLTGVYMILLKDRKIAGTKQFVEVSGVRVIDMTKEEILDYIATGEPMDKAGAYGIQGYFARYVEGIEGDYSNIVGLPVCRVYRALRGLCNDL